MLPPIAVRPPAMTVLPPARLPLANLPTPLQASPRLGSSLGLDLWWKRDDLTGAELSGNKIRKLEYLLADAVAQGADTVVTCGGAQSNHCRATAAAAARLGLRAVLLLRTADPSAPPPLEANSLLGHLAGADIRWVSVEQYRARREILFPRIEAELKSAGRKPYLFPEGGSNALGTWGYVQAVGEVLGQLPDDGRPTTLVYAAGSGGTGAGIELGVRLAAAGAMPAPDGGKGPKARTGVRVLGFAVCDDAQTFQNDIARIAGLAIERWQLPVTLTPADVDIDDGSIGPGYAQATDEGLALIAEVARTDGVFLDPVYTGKAFQGLVRRAQAGHWAPGARVVFFHTGGLFGLFPFASALARAV